VNRKAGRDDWIQVVLLLILVKDPGATLTKMGEFDVSKTETKRDIRYGQ